MSADICSDVGQNIKSDATATSQDFEKEHLSTSNANNGLKRNGKLLFLICHFRQLAVKK